VVGVKAAVYHRTGPPDVFSYEDVPDPEPLPGFVVIDVEVVSIEGGDVLNRAGGELASVPHVVGYQAAGTISAVGEGVGDRTAGQRVVGVMTNGSHAERFLVPAATTWPIPDGADIRACGCVPVACGTAHECLFGAGGLQAGESVLIQAGAGGVGIGAIQLAKRAGATVFATASQPSKLERLGPLGCDHAINYAEVAVDEEVRRLTDGRGVDLVVDPVGGRTLEASLRCLAYAGRAVTVGNAGREGGSPIDVSPLMGNNATLRGVFLGAEITSPRVHGMIAGLIDDVAAGRLEVPIEASFPLSEAADAHALIESRQAFGRVILEP
jgi:NADPH2:quinone reductase